MIDDHRKGKIKRFMADLSMKDAVYEVLLQSYLRQRDGDVNLKAAQMTAVELLNDGWKELEKLSRQTEKEPTEKGNVGI